MLMVNLTGIRTTTIMMPPPMRSATRRLMTIGLNAAMCMRAATAASGTRGTPVINYIACIITIVSGTGMVKNATNKSW